MTLVADLAGLNATEIPSMPIINAETALEAAVKANARQSVAGMRHSQGGQTTLSQAPMLLTEAMDAVVYDTQTKTVTADCGATWSAVQHVINQHGRALFVQQSSAHFSIGGSLSVNCHGRDGRQGPLSSSVQSIDVMLADGTKVVASPTQKEDLYWGALGGYGACGVIIRATFQTTENWMLTQEGTIYNTAGDYGDLLRDRQANPHKWPDMHYGWLNFTPGKLYDSVLSMDYKSINRGPADAAERELHEEAWSTNELMRGAWNKARTDGKFRKQLWDLVVGQMKGVGKTKSRVNWQRAPTAFTMHKGKAFTDLLQEYFVPLDQFENMTALLKKILTDNDVVVLSTTLRVVQADTKTFLSYCRKPMVCFAVDVSVPVIQNGSTLVPAPSVGNWVRKAIDAAVDQCGGSFYLPYFQFATRAQFEKAYGPASVGQWRDAAARYNAGRRLDNDFLKTYL